jgi:hypothetical protein
MKKYLAKLKSNKGVTLTELLVGIGMLALFLSAISLLFSGLNRSRDAVIELAELNTLLDNISAPIIRDLTNTATRLNFCDEPACKPADPNCEAVNSCICVCHSNPLTVDEISIPLGGISIVYTICDDAACACGGENILVLDCRSVECNVVLPCNEAACQALTVCNIANCGCDCHNHHHPVLQKAFYKGKSVSFTVAPAPAASGVTYILTVTVYRDVDGAPSISFMNEVISREYAIRPLGLNQFNN